MSRKRTFTCRFHVSQSHQEHVKCSLTCHSHTYSPVSLIFTFFCNKPGTSDSFRYLSAPPRNFPTLPTSWSCLPLKSTFDKEIIMLTGHCSPIIAHSRMVCVEEGVTNSLQVSLRVQLANLFFLTQPRVRFVIGTSKSFCSHIFEAELSTPTALHKCCFNE